MQGQIRRASIHDLDALVPLFDGYRQFYRQASDPALARVFLRERLSQHDSLILLACEGARGLGFTQLYPMLSSVRAARTYLLNDLFVTADARRQGVARELMMAAAEHARELGVAALSLATALDNVPAQTLYESLGWRRDTQFCAYGLVL